VQKRKKIDRGSILAAVVAASGLKVTDIAKKAGYSRSSYYKHIEDPDLQFHILLKYGKALNYDFRKDIEDMPDYQVEEPTSLQNPTNLQEALKALRILNDRYIDLLERYTLLLEENFRKLLNKK